jgi:hypothetical protein
VGFDGSTVDFGEAVIDANVAQVGVEESEAGGSVGEDSFQKGEGHGFAGKLHRRSKPVDGDRRRGRLHFCL